MIALRILGLIRDKNVFYLYIAVFLLGLMSGCKSSRGDSLEEVNSLTVFPRLISFIRPSLDERLSDISAVVEFEVWFDLDEQGHFTEIDYKAKDANSEKYPRDDWRRKVAEASLDAVEQWKCTPLVINGEGTLAVVDIYFHVEIEDGIVSRWLIMSVEDDVIFDSDIGNEADCPLFL